jgi:hypothetical protein
MIKEHTSIQLLAADSGAHAEASSNDSLGSFALLLLLRLHSSCMQACSYPVHLIPVDSSLTYSFLPFLSAHSKARAGDNSSSSSSGESFSNRCAVCATHSTLWLWAGMLIHLPCNPLLTLVLRHAGFLGCSAAGC